MPQNRYLSIVSGAGVVAGVINTYIASTPDDKLPPAVIKYRFWISIVLLSLIAFASYNNPTSKDSF